MGHPQKGVIEIWILKCGVFLIKADGQVIHRNIPGSCGNHHSWCKCTVELSCDWKAVHITASTNLSTGHSKTGLSASTLTFTQCIVSCLKHIFKGKTWTNKLLFQWINAILIRCSGWWIAEKDSGNVSHPIHSSPKVVHIDFTQFSRWP